MSYRDITNATANDIKEFAAKEDVRRKEELAMVERQMKENSEQLAAIRQAERDRRDAEEQRHERNRLEMHNFQRKAYESNLDRQDKRLKENYEKEDKAIQDHHKALEKQRELLATDVQNKTKYHLEEMQRKEKRLKDEAKKTEKKVTDLKETKLDLQNKLNDALKQYHKDHLETKTRHFGEIEDLEIVKQEVLVQREQNAINAQERLTIQNQEFAGHIINVVDAGRYDQMERGFIDAVINTRRAGNEATNAVSHLGDNAYQLKSGQEANPSVVEALKHAIAVVVTPLLDELNHNAMSIREQRESKNKVILECQAAAEKIDAAVIALRSSLSEFRASLNDNPIENSRELYKLVVENNKAMGKAVSALPAVSQNDYAIEAIVSHTRQMVVTTCSTELKRN